MSSCPKECGSADFNPAKAKEQDLLSPTALPHYTCRDSPGCCKDEKEVEEIKAVAKEAEDQPESEKGSQELHVKPEAPPFNIAEAKKDDVAFENSKPFNTVEYKMGANLRLDPNLQVLTQSAKNLAKPTGLRPPRSPAKSPAKSPRDSVTMSPATAKLSPRGLPRTSRSSFSGSTSPRLSPKGKRQPPLPQGDNLKAVLFDVDGTIADSDPLHFQAFQEMLVEAGFNNGEPISQEYFISHMSGKLNTVIAHELLPDIDDAMRQTLLAKKEARFRSLASSADLKSIPGFHRFVKWVKQRGLKRAAVTNAPRENAEQLLNALGVFDFFDVLVVGSECEHPKPHPDPYMQAIKHLDVEPAQTFVVEDSPLGVKAGVAAGLPTVALLTGHPGPVLKSSGAVFLIKDYNDPDLWANLGCLCEVQHSPLAPPPSTDTSSVIENKSFNVLKVVA